MMGAKQYSLGYSKYEIFIKQKYQDNHLIKF